MQVIKATEDGLCCPVNAIGEYQKGNPWQWCVSAVPLFDTLVGERMTLKRLGQVSG